jgi:CrcB protein
MDLILVGVGGAIGSLSRYQLGKLLSKRKRIFPVGTFIINITGAALLGVVTSLDIGSSAYLLTADGFLGAFTTFSTFMYEGFELFRGNKKINALIYIFVSLLLGVAGFIAGHWAARL